MIIFNYTYIYIYVYIYIYTSSTAQGGGGSFKNRKPIGEVGCCESGMAERSHWWTKRCLRSPFFRSLSLTIYLPTYLFSMYLSIYRSIYLSLSFFHSITQSIYLSICLSISKSGPSMVCFVHFDLEMCFAPQRRTLFQHLNLQKWSEHGVFAHFDLEMCFAPQGRALFQHLNFQKWSGTEVFCTFWLGNVLRATTACTFSTSQLPKVVRAWCALYILTWKCASRHNGVHFFDISTSKSGPSMVCFVHFDLEMCFAPQRRTLFQHLNLQKVVRAWCVLYILTLKCASRHNGVHFFNISTSKSGPELRCFVHFDS